MKIFKKSIFLACFLLLFITPLAWGVADNDPGRKWLFKDLQNRLITDGFDTERISLIFSHDDVAFADRVVSSYFMHRESTLNYGQFLNAESIKRARNYMETHAEQLSVAQKKYGVEPQIITAILLVETRLGTFVGNSSILNTLATMASMNSDDNRDLLWMENITTFTISRKQYDEKALSKAGWAYRELKALLEYTAREEMDPIGIKGSYAGAMGIAQFMPSNALTLAVDGDKDGKIDLFTHADAIASVANYLKRYGWKPGISREQQYKSVFHYNRSSYYVNTILEIADLLKE